MIIRNRPYTFLGHKTREKGFENMELIVHDEGKKRASKQSSENQRITYVVSLGLGKVSDCKARSRREKVLLSETNDIIA